MNIINIIVGILGVLASILTIMDVIYSILKKKTPYFKRLFAWVTNKKYKIQLMGIKKYSNFELDMGEIKNELFNKYSKVNVMSEKENSLIILIENMQAPYEILIYNDEGEENVKTNLIVRIVLIGSVEFRYRESDDYNKFFIVLDNLFDIIEHIMNQKPNYSFFTLQADIKNEFRGKPFISENIRDECEDTKLNIDKTVNYIKINSKSKDNLYKCLKKNIHKVL